MNAPILPSADAPDNRPRLSFAVWAVGKPGFDYSPIKVEFSGQLLRWDLANLTKSEMIGQAGRVAKHISALEKWLEAVKEILKAEAPGLAPKVGDSKEVLGGDGMAATFSHRSRVGIDNDLLKTKYGDAWFAAHCKETEYYEIRWKEVK